MSRYRKLKNLEHKSSYFYKKCPYCKGRISVRVEVDVKATGVVIK